MNKLLQKKSRTIFSPLLDVVMNGLGATFVLLMIYLILISGTDPRRKAMEKGQQLIENELKSALISTKILPEYGHRIDGDRQIISFANEVLFPIGKYELSPKGEIPLRVLAKILKKYQNIIYDSEKEAGFFSTIAIDGHTDNRPIYDPFVRSNWHLSSLRAISVLEFFDKNDVDSTIMSPTGYADTKPVVPDKSDFRNRRVEITLVYSIEAIREAMDKK